MKTSEKMDKVQSSQPINWQEWYVLSEHWQSDLEFYKDDLRFLHKLVDKYFIWITKSENLQIVKEIMLQIQGLEKKCYQLLEELVAHKIDLSHHSEADKKTDPDTTAQRHDFLEKEISQFVKDFRANRKEVFRITEYVIDSEDLTGIIRS